MEDSDFIDIKGLLEPKSVAVIGASDRPGNMGGLTVQRLTELGFPGPVWPVNPKADTVAGVRCHPKVSDLPGVPDLVIMATPANTLIDVIRECAEAGVRNGIAFAGGFAEAGGNGVDLQRSLAAVCKEERFALCGPNCVGIINTSVPAPLTFATALHGVEKLKPGVISMVSQSGGVGTNAFSQALKAGFPFRHLVSSGNEAVVTFSDYIYGLARDDGTQFIGGYLEGVDDGAKFVRAIEEARRRGKPVVLIKVGAAGASAVAARAHTGALVGEDRVFEAIFQEFGVIRVDSIVELVDTLMLLASMKRHLPAGPGVGIVTFGGGGGVLAADQCAKAGLSTPPLRPECAEKMRPLLVSVATAANPLDLTPMTAFREESMARLPQVLDLLADEPGIDAVLFSCSMMGSKATEICDVLCDFSKRMKKPLCASYASAPAGVTERLANEGIYAFPDPARAIRSLARLQQSLGFASRRSAPEVSAARAFDWSRVVCEQGAQFVVPEHRSHQILKQAGLRAAAGELATDEASALRAADSVGRPVALKGISPAITHRAAAGLVILDARTPEEVAAAYRQIMARARDDGHELLGVYVQKMHRGGDEILVSAFRDPLFGVMVSCGLGGALAEAIGRVVTARAPVDLDLASAILGGLAVRGHEPCTAGTSSPDPAAEFVARFSELAVTAPWSRFVFEINPVKWTRDSAVAVDGMIVVDQA